ncbi:MAG: MgtC/SapB family protein [Bacteroidetes bacterium]|nr:MgtC/SapB family protein [Bacteroidota bacterium]
MLPWSEILIRLLLASFYGALVGLERERKNWSAGLRTHTMVALGSCLIMIVSAFGFADILGTPNVVLDPSRVAAQVVSGIGFIGAGTILFLKQGVIRGLTTAAGLWTVAAIGLATGGGMYFAAGATTIIALIVLWGMQRFEQLYFKKSKRINLSIVTIPNPKDTEMLKGLLNSEHLTIHSFSFEKGETSYTYLIELENNNLSKIEFLIKELEANPTVKEVNWAK